MKIRLLAALLLFFAHSVVAEDTANDISPGDFAFAVPIEGVGADALYRLVISPPVYEGATYTDLRDLRVFNGAGEVVPHAFRPLDDLAAHQPAPVYLPIFALRGPSGTRPDDLDIVVNTSNVKFSLRSSSGKPIDDRAVLLGYLVDLSANKGTLSKLLLDWERAPNGYVGAVNVEASDDLKHWKRIASNAPLVSLAQGGQKLEQKSITLRRVRTKYLRLTWPPGVKVVKLNSVFGQQADEATPRERTWKEIPALPDPEARGDYLADLGGIFPVDRLEIRLPQNNSVAPTRIFSRNKPDNEWVSVMRTVAYRLRQNGQEIANPEIAITPRMRRYWLFRIDQQGGGIGEGTIQVRAGWIAREIVFTARGDGPFMLAFGNGKASPNALAMQTLVPGWGGERAPEISLAMTGAVKTLAGAAAARQRIDMKKVALWVALLAGVAVLGFMAWRLSKQLQSGADPDPATPVERAHVP
jgi:hypothetical protein